MPFSLLSSAAKVAAIAGAYLAITSILTYVAEATFIMQPDDDGNDEDGDKAQADGEKGSCHE